MLSTDIPNPNEWGWLLAEGESYVSIPTDTKYALFDILKVVSCKCSVDKEYPCSSNICSCRKHGLPCFKACLNCVEDRCKNATQISFSLPEGSELDRDSEEDDVEVVLPAGEDIVVPDILNDCVNPDANWLDEETVLTTDTVLHVDI